MSEKSYPPDWNDDERMSVLFSPFRDGRDVNPRSWDSKMRFWTDMIHKHCVGQKVLVFNAKKLPDMFERKGKIPYCLNIVLNELNRNGTIQKVSDYFENVDGSWLSWSLNLLVKRPMRWGYNTVVKGSLSWAYGRVFGKDDDSTYYLRSPNQMIQNLPDEEYVIVDLVKDMANTLYQRHSESVTYAITDNVVEYETFRNKCRDICADEKSFNIAVLELCRQKLCTVSQGPDGEKLIRMVTKKNDKPRVLTENDRHIYRLKTAESKLEAEITKINGEMEACRLNAKSCLQEGKKNLALKYLKRKKMLETQLAQKEQAVDKINNLVTMIQQTESQKQILDAYESGVKAFKGITNKFGLTEDNIDKTMDGIEDAFDKNEEINQTISRPIGEQYDDDDLEKELAQILAESESTKFISDLLPSIPGASDVDMSEILDLPDVPSHNPSVTPMAASNPLQDSSRKTIVREH